MARKRSNKNKSKLSKILSIILLIASIILLISLMYINILPITQLGIIAAITLIIDLIIITSMHKSKRKVLSYILSLFLTIIMLVGSFYTLKTTGLINNLNLNYKTYNYSVIVLKKSKYKKIDDIKNKKLGYYNTDGDETKKSLSKLSKKISTNNTSYDDVNALASSVLDNKEDAIIIEDSYLKILEEDNEKENNSKKDTESFKDKTKTIYKFSIVIKTNNISKDTDVTKKPFNIYISGIDTYGQISSVSRSDVNMIVTVNPKTKQILLTSIPRDYYVQLHGKTGYKDKLTHAGLYGADMSVNTLEDLLNIEINYYVKVNFTSVINIVEALGGVEVYSDYTFTSIDGYNYTKGYNKVNGEQALSFARERKAFSEGDRQRVKDQQALLEAMFRKCTSPAIITKYNSLMNSINGSFVTNMSANRITSLIRMQLIGKYKWIITSNSLDGENSSNYTYSYSAQKLYVMEPIEDSVKYAKELIDSVIDGEKLDPTYDGNASDVHSVSRNKQPTNKNTEQKKNDTENKEGLKANLNRPSITIIEGDTYTYHGYKATYNGIDITSSSEATFSINGKTYNDYKDLVSYITNSLEKGEYNIVYKITYKESSLTLNQSLIIKEKETTYTDTSNDTDNNIDNNDTKENKDNNQTQDDSNLDQEEEKNNE